VRCRLFAYGPADATASQNPIISYLIHIQTGFTFMVLATQVVQEKRPLNGCSSSSIVCYSKRQWHVEEKVYFPLHMSVVKLLLYCVIMLGLLYSYKTSAMGLPIYLLYRPTLIYAVHHFIDLFSWMAASLGTVRLAEVGVYLLSSPVQQALSFTGISRYSDCSVIQGGPKTGPQSHDHNSVHS